jgi:chromosome partition protein MukB
MGSTIAAELAQADREDRQLHADVAVAANCVDQADKEQARTRDAWRKTLIELRPNWRNWIGLRREAARLGVLDRLVRVAESYQALGPPNVMGLASERRGQLGEAVKNADGGMDLAQQLARGPGAASAEGTAGLRDLRAWGLVRGFLEQSIPRDIAQSDDPQVALEQIGQHLTLLRERLLDQEQSLRHSTEEIANSIQVKIRREEARIHGLNRGLARVRFGSIRGVRIHLERQPMMLKLLDAMRTQPDLFEQDAPLEDALAAVYQHLGGGQIQGEHLLDYRQYIRIGVQVQRLGRDAWMEARAGALSTGESIGVGAAVLVVILDAWEQQAALLKGRKGGQALRFLFLDEANRLSPESLDTLTELCEQMQVQLLAAAPAADRGRRGHIYRLVRRTDSTGAEEVIVRGRRMRDLDP